MMEFAITSGRASGGPEKKNGSSCQLQQSIFSASVVAAPHAVLFLRSYAKTTSHFDTSYGCHCGTRHWLFSSSDCLVLSSMLANCSALHLSKTGCRSSRGVSPMSSAGIKVTEQDYACCLDVCLKWLATLPRQSLKSTNRAMHRC